jgi:hypothetical protein
MRELKMKRFKAYAAKLRATIRQIKQDGGSGMGISRDDIAQHVGGGAGGAGEKKKEKVRARFGIVALPCLPPPPPPLPPSSCFFFALLRVSFSCRGLKNPLGLCQLLRRSK